MLSLASLARVKQLIEHHFSAGRALKYSKRAVQVRIYIFVQVLFKRLQGLFLCFSKGICNSLNPTILPGINTQAVTLTHLLYWTCRIPATGFVDFWGSEQIGRKYFFLEIKCPNKYKAGN